MDGQQCEMVWTDPPYGVAVGDKNKYLNTIAPSNRIEENLVNDALDEVGLSEMLGAAFGHAVQHTKDGGAWYVAAAAVVSDWLTALILRRFDIWHQTIQWVKNNATFSPMGVDYHWQAEPIFYGWKPGAGHRYYGGRKQTTVWEIDRPTASPEHPTMKPLALVARAVENSSLPGEIVCDPFLGSGSTLIAAEQLDRVCYGMEIAPRYVDVIVKRWEEFTGQKAMCEPAMCEPADA
jgi:DNA modification methylase